MSAVGGDSVNDSRAVAWCCDLLAGLASLHNANIMHNDLSPSTVFVEHANGREILKIGDYGLSENVGARINKKTRRVSGMDGPPHSPESEAGQDYSFPHDVYCAGRIVHMIFTLKLLDNDDRVDLGVKVSDKYDPVVQVMLPRILAQMLHREPDKRPTAAALVDTFYTLGKMLQVPHDTCSESHVLHGSAPLTTFSVSPCF